MNRRILFTRHYDILDPFISCVSGLGRAFILTDARYQSPLISKVKIIKINYGLLWLVNIFNKLHLDTAIPVYIKNFLRITESIQPDTIISFDFFRIYFWQSIWYVKRHPETKLFLWSETRRLPTNPLSRLAMILFLWRLRRNVKHIEKILVWTEEGRRFFADQVSKVDIILMPAPIDTEMFYPNSQKYFMKDDVFRILMNARYIPLKRHCDMLQALLVLKKRGIRCQLSLVGNGGHLQESIRHQVEILGLNDEVKFLPPVPITGMRQYYIDHDIVVLPSSNEGIGMAVPEAMACGLPTITSDAVGANVYVKEGETGLIFKAKDISALVSCLQVMADPERLRTFGGAARKRVEDQFTIQHTQTTFLSTLARESKKY